jgi:ribosomal protein S18 acetylase RimI-like enzyme
MRLDQHTRIIDSAVARDLLRIQHRAYAVEAALIGDDRIPALHETVADLTAANLRWWVAVDDAPGGPDEGRILGAIGFTVGAIVDIDRLVVDPGAFRRGIGRTLVDSVVSAAGGRPVDVATGAANVPARRLYESIGFRLVDEIEPVPGLRVSRYSYSAPPRSTMAATGPPPSGP